MHRVAVRMRAAKVAAALGVACLVSAFALASLLDPLASLAQAIMRVNGTLLQTIDQAPHSPAIQWAWTNLAVPLLLRPCWMLPVMAGLVLVGVAATLVWGDRR